MENDHDNSIFLRVRKFLNKINMFEGMFEKYLESEKLKICLWNKLCFIKQQLSNSNFVRNFVKFSFVKLV